MEKPSYKIGIFMITDVDNNEAYELDDDTSSHLIDVAFNIIQESIQVDLDNGNITEDDIAAFNEALDADVLYQEIVRPPAYDWGSVDENLADILSSPVDAMQYAEVYFAAEGSADGIGNKQYFVVVLIKLDSLGSEDEDKGEAYLKWHPQDCDEILD